MRHVRRGEHPQLAIGIGEAGRKRVERRDVAGLDDPQRPVLRVCPLDVLRPPVVLLDAHARRCELAQARVVERVAATLDDRSIARVDDVVVGIHLARDEPLPEAADGVDRHAPACPGDRVGREQDTSDVGVDHALDHDREAYGRVVDRVRRAVRDRAVVPERRPAAAHGFENGVFACDIENRVLLPGEARVGQVFRGRRRPDGDVRRAHRAVRVTDRGRDRRGDR